MRCWRAMTGLACRAGARIVAVSVGTLEQRSTFLAEREPPMECATRNEQRANTKHNTRIQCNMQPQRATCAARDVSRRACRNIQINPIRLAGSPQRLCRALNESRMPPPPLVRVGSKRRRTRPMLLPYDTCHGACCATWHPACLHGMAVLGASRASAATCSSSSRPTPTRFTSHIGAATPSILLCVCWVELWRLCAQRGFGDGSAERQLRRFRSGQTDGDCPRSCGCSS
jgi:hypothetical protein